MKLTSFKNKQMQPFKPNKLFTCCFCAKENMGTPGKPGAHVHSKKLKSVLGWP